MRGIDATGSPICSDLLDFVNTRCRLFFGWRDNCDSCTSVPLKYGRVNDDACSSLTGTDSSCLVATLGGQDVRMYGVNTDGDVNDDDKFYIGIKCY